MSARNETLEQREHRYDRELAAAIWHRKRTQQGKGYKFVAPRRRKARP